MNDDIEYSKHNLTTLMAERLRELLAQIDQLSDEQMLGPTDAAGWNVRDHLTHLAVWAEGIAALIRDGNRWQAMGLDIQDLPNVRPDYDQINATIAQAHRHMTPAEARAWVIKAHEGVLAVIDTLTDDDLLRPYGDFTNPKLGSFGHPIGDYIHGNTAGHYEEHLPWILAIVHPSTATKAG